MSDPRVSYLDGKESQVSRLDAIADYIRVRLAQPDNVTLRTARSPMFIGMGASYAATALPVHRLREAGLASWRTLASELPIGDLVPEADIVIAVSQSGRSTETLAAMDVIEQGRRATVTNAISSALASMSHVGTDLGGVVDSYASTIAYTGTLIALDGIVDAILTEAGIDAGPWSWDGIGTVVADMQHLAARAIATVAERASMCVAADVVGTGAHRSATEAGALLLREVARIPSMASSTRNYLHGEMESAGQTLHIVVGDDREIELAQTLADAGHLTILVTAASVSGNANLVVVPIPKLPTGPRCVLETIVMQELASALADARGIDIEDFVFANQDTKQGGILVEGVRTAGSAP